MNQSLETDESRNLGIKDFWDKVETQNLSLSTSLVLEMVEFIAQVVGVTSKILDPCAQNGLLLAAITKTSKPDLAVGVVNDPNLEQVLSQLGPKIDWHFGSYLEGLEDLQEQNTQFDVIISYLEAELGLDQEAKNNYYELISKSCQLLYGSGKAFFILPNSFFAEGFPKIKDSLAKKDIFIWSVVSLPNRWDIKGKPIDLIEIRTYPTDKLFVAKASFDSSNSSLITNLIQRCQSEIVEFGSLIDPNSFFTWDGYATELVFHNSAKLVGAKVIKLIDITLEIHLADKALESGFIDKLNDIFLPIQDASQVLTTLPGADKTQQYIQLVFDPKLANSKYMAKYFDTHLGRLSRLILQRGNALSQACIDVIQRVPIGIHNLDQQNEIVMYQQRIDELQVLLQTTQHDLWSPSKGVRTVEPVLQLFPDTNDLNTWIPRLPYPLASILWTHEATLDIRRKSEILFAFFEATAEFITMILLSGLQSNKVIYNQLKSSELVSLQSNLWKSTTFGFWVTNGRNLAKTLRHKLQDPTQRLIYLNLFKCSGNWLELLIHEEIFQVLDRVSRFRNNWKGHGGVESDAENKQHYQRLRQELISLFVPLSHCFEQLILIRPKTMECEDGEVFKVLVNKLTGANVPFQESTFYLSSLVNTNNNLYLLETHGSQALELLPFVRIESSPEIACYFYSQIKQNSVRFVSYHQASRSEILPIDKKISFLVDELSK